MKTGKSAVYLEEKASSSGGLSDVGRGVPPSPLTHFYQGRHWVLANNLGEEKKSAVS